MIRARQQYILSNRTLRKLLQVTPGQTLKKLSDPAANITVLMPPPDAARGLLYSHSKGDLSAEDARDVVLVHILAEKLTFQDLVALPKETLVDTLLDGASPIFHFYGTNASLAMNTPIP